MSRIFCKSEDISGQMLRLTRDKYHYLKDVLRLKVGDTMTLVVSSDVGGDTVPSSVQVLQIKVCVLSQSSVEFETLSLCEDPIGSLQTVSDVRFIGRRGLLRLILIQALPKQDKMSDIIKKCTEIGVTDIIPLRLSRCVSDPDGQKLKSKQVRWQAVAENASVQSQRVRIPVIHETVSLAELCRHPLVIQCALSIVAWEGERSRTLYEVLHSQSTPPSSVCIVIGPEGGITEGEIATLAEAGFVSVSIADTVLRTENAGFLALGNVGFYFLG